jgi:hypothetical protein
MAVLSLFSPHLSDMKYATSLAKIAVIGSFAFLYGCASVNKAPAADDAAAKAFQPKPGVAQVYVYRNETLGAAVSMPVTVDGKLAGSTGANTYFKFDLAPGKHRITSQGDGSVLDLDAEAGKLYFVWQEVKMGLMSGGSKLQVVDSEKGRKGVAECSLIQANP